MWDITKRSSSENTKADKRASKRFKNRYGHFGLGSSHVREASEAEVLHHWRKAKDKKYK